MTAGSRPLAAAGSILGAMALIGLIDNAVIRIAGLGGLWQFHLMRAAMAIPLILILARAMGWRVRPRRWWAVGLRSLFVSLSMLLYFGALAFIPVAEAAAGLFTAPIWVLLISVAVYKDRVGWIRSAAVLIGFAGILLVLRPWGAALSWVSLMPVAAGLLYAIGALATRRLCADEGVLAILLAFFLLMAAWGALGTLAMEAWGLPDPGGADGFLLRGWNWPSAELLGLTGLQAAGSVAGVGLLTRGYLLADASYVAAFEYVLLIFAAFWGWVLWQEVPDALALAGIGLILAGGVVLTLRGRDPDTTGAGPAS